MSLYKNQLGLSLIEVLISLLLLSLALLGLDAMNVMALRANRAAYFLGVATNQLQVMTDRLRVFKDTVSLDQQLLYWNVQNQQVLPEGYGTIRGHHPVYTLTIYWGNMPKDDCPKPQLGQSGCLQEKMA